MRDIVLTVEREGRQLTVIFNMPQKIAQKLRALYTEGEFRDIAKARGLECSNYLPLVVEQRRDGFTINAAEIYHYEFPVTQVITLSNSTKAKALQEALVSFCDTTVAPFIRTALDQTKETKEVSLALDTGKVLPEFKFPSPQITLSDSAPLFITDGNGKTYVATLKPTKRKNALAEFKAALKAQAEEQVEAIKKMFQGQLEAYQALAQQTIDQAKVREREARNELEELRRKTQLTLLTSNPTDYLKYKIFVVPNPNTNTIFYCREFIFSPEFVSYFDEDTGEIIRARIPDHIRQKITIPNLFLAFSPQSDNVYIVDKNLNGVQTYHSYASGEVCKGTINFDTPTSVAEVNAILDTIEAALKTINDESVLTREPRLLVSLYDILDAVLDNDTSTPSKTVWEVEEATV